MSTLATPQTATTTWNIDPAHSVAEFKVKHMMISNVKGQFAKVSGVLTLDESELKNSRIEALIEAASIETRDAQRDTHLKSADFFDVEKFSTLSFKSTRISLVRDGELAAEGDLTILTWNAALETGGILVGDEITITLDVQFVKA